MNGQTVRRHVLKSDKARVTILSLGCITQKWEVRKDGVFQPVTLGYDEPGHYLRSPSYLGAIVGRMAGRIGGASFDIDGEPWKLSANEGRNQLHGGPQGLSRQVWTMEADGHEAVRLHYVSRHLDQGYPGELRLSVNIRLDGDWLTYEMEAQSDRPTPVSLAQHNYYSLTPGKMIDDHVLTLPASEVLPTRSDLTVTGEIVSVGGVGPDFRGGVAIAEADLMRKGIDLTYVLDQGAPIRLSGGGLELEMQTDQPCLQLYTGDLLKPMHGADHRKRMGLCLEPQLYPDALNHPAFPVNLCTPDHPYRQVLRVRISETAT